MTDLRISENSIQNSLQREFRHDKITLIICRGFLKFARLVYVFNHKILLLNWH